MSADAIVKSVINDIPKSVAAGVVDMGSGMLLSIKTVESHPQQVLDILAPATKEMFEGDMVTQIENLFKQARGVDSKEHYFNEMLVGSTNLWHYFGRIKSSRESVLVAVTAQDVNVGMLLMKARQICESANL
jgi:hypothetical protein